MRACDDIAVVRRQAIWYRSPRSTAGISWCIALFLWREEAYFNWTFAAGLRWVLVPLLPKSRIGAVEQETHRSQSA